jgi:hypothetical protein
LSLSRQHSAADARPPWRRGRVPFHHHHDSRCPDADGGKGTSKSGACHPTIA